MKIFLIIVGYFLPAIISTIIMSCFEKHNILKKIKESLNNFDNKNKGPVYNFLKTILFIIILLFGIIIFLSSFALIISGGFLFSNYVINDKYVLAIGIILLNIIADIIIFSFMDK